MRPFQGRTIIFTHQVQSWLEKSPEFLMKPKQQWPLWSNHSNHFQHSNNSSNQPNFSNYQQNFSNQAPQSYFQNPQLERRMTNFEKNMKRYMKNQDSLIQIIQRLEVQMSQLDNPQNERQKGTMPSQPIMNPRNSQQAWGSIIESM